MATKSVNHLAAATTNTHRAMGFDAPPQPDLRPTAVQRHVLTDMHRRICAYGLQPEDMNEEGALAEVLSSRDLYSQDPKHIADYNVDKLKVVRRAFQPLDARARLPPGARALLEDFHVRIERTEAEMEVIRETQDTPRPYWDPKFRGSRSEMLRLFLAFYERGLMSLRSKLKGHIGIFFVRKKDDMIRLIVDARAANLHHKPPPVTRLGSASCMASLDLSDARLRSTGFGGLVELDPAGNEGDVGDCYYNFLLEELASWFGAPIAFQAQELRRYGFVVDSTPSLTTNSAPSDSSTPRTQSTSSSPA